jgi:diguanylate cyclase (GGDEF)-like protein
MTGDFTLPSFSTDPARPHPGSAGNHQRGMLAAVFYLAGGGMVAVAALDPAAYTLTLLILGGMAVAVGVAAVLARRLFVYAATVTTSVLGPVLIAAGVVAGSGSWASALLALLYTFVAVHTALVLHWKHATAVLIWAAATAVIAARLVDAPLPAWSVGVVFVLCCGTLAAVTLWLVAEVRRRADTDPLTGVANRTSFETALRHAKATVSRTGEPLALVALDLDGFRKINNTYGHAAGDRLLIEATRAWQPHLRARDQLARIGGDEFCVVLPGANEDQARAVADRLEQAMPTGTACSTGVAVWEYGQTLTELSAAADRDLYASKTRKR